MSRSEILNRRTPTDLSDASVNNRTSAPETRRLGSLSETKQENSLKKGTGNPQKIEQEIPEKPLGNSQGKRKESNNPQSTQSQPQTQFEQIFKHVQKTVQQQNEQKSLRNSALLDLSTQEQPEKVFHLSTQGETNQNSSLEIENTFGESHINNYKSIQGDLCFIKIFC